jgi:transcriptional regulator with XRE-family HTH domain
MDTSSDIREFLISRRAKLTPEQAGLPNFGGRRRVPGLRREEVALLAGMSTEYYTRLERGTALGVSESVLEGISRALHLDEAEHTHLYDLVRAANEGTQPRRRRGPTRSQQVKESVQQTIDAMADIPVVAQNGRLDIVASNRLGYALFSEMYVQPQRPANFGRFVFLDPRAEAFYQDFESAAHQTVALLRSEAGRSPHDRILSDLVGELSTRNELFRKLWASHDVRDHQTGVKSIHHPAVGDLNLNYEGMQLASDRSLLLLAYTAPVGSASYDGLQLLATWAATNEDTSQRVVAELRADTPQ